MTPAPALPRWIYLPAAVGALFVVLPLVAIVAKVDWPQFWSLITDESSRAALALSLKTAAASTLLCVLFGVPMALVLARNDGRAVHIVRPLLLLPLVLPPVVGGIALLYAFGRLGLVGQYLDAGGCADRVHDDGGGAGADLRVAAVSGHRARRRGAHVRPRLRRGGGDARRPTDDGVVAGVAAAACARPGVGRGAGVRPLAG